MEASFHGPEQRQVQKMQVKHDVLVIGDPHIRVNREKECADMVREVLRIAKDTKPKFIVILGDTLHSHHTINVYPLSWATDFILSLVDVAPTFLLIGNHDRPNNSDFLSGYHPFTGMVRTPGLTVVDTTKEASFDGKRFIFVPYVPPGRFDEALSKVERPFEATAIFAHQEIRGAKMGKVKSRGDRWQKERPLVISGHIHMYQRLRNNVVYVGAPGQHNFEDEEVRTISTFSFTDGSWSEQRHRLELRAKVILRISPSEIADLEIPDAGIWTKIVIRGTIEEIRASSKLPKVRMWKKKGATIVADEVASESLVEDVESSTSFEMALFQEAERDPELMKAWNHVFRG